LGNYKTHLPRRVLDFWRNAFVSFASILFTIAELRNKVDVSVYFLTTTPEDRILTA
jgi:hypothetical protein